MGVSVRIISSGKLTVEKRHFIEYFGGCHEIAHASPAKWHFLNQLHNPANPAAHTATTGPEILAQAPQVTAVVGSIGSGGTLLGVGRYLKQINDQIKIIAAETAPGTRLPGTAALLDGDYRTPFMNEGFAHNIFDFSVRVGEAEAVDTARLMSATGLFGGLQTWAVIAAAWRAVESHDLRGDVVVISGDTGWKNIGVLSQKVLGRNGSNAADPL